MVQTRPQKRIVLSSDDEDDPASTPRRTVPKKDRGQVARGKRQSSTDARKENEAPSIHQGQDAAEKRTAHTKQPKNASKLSKEQSKTIKSKSLHSFFGPRAQQPVESDSTKRTNPNREQREVEEPEELDEIIDDEVEGERFSGSHARTTNSGDVFPFRKRPSHTSTEDSVTQSKRARTGPGFLKKDIAPKPTDLEKNTIPVQTALKEPWTDVYCPQSLEELAVHPKKIADVRNWLESVLNGRIYQRLLVLKGPAGAGKTTLLSLLSKQLGVSVLEWHNPDLSDIASGDYVSFSSQFADFLSRAGQYHRLDIVETVGHSLRPVDSHEVGFKRMVLVEEFPSTGGSSSTALLAFRSQIQQFLASSVRSESAQYHTPLIISVSESLLSASESNDRLTAHRLLGRDILHHPATTVIEFNTVAPTFITKALRSVVQKHTRETGRAHPVSPSVVKQLAEIGDVRNAVSTLEYLFRHFESVENKALSSHEHHSKQKSKPRRSKVTKSSTDDSQRGSSDERALSLISTRESTLGLFHAVGKVVYNKRTEDVDQATTGLGHVGQPPPVMQADALISAAGTDASTFLSALHENYLLSCKPPSDLANNDAALAHVEGCLDALGEADVLDTVALGSFDVKRRAGVASEGLRQEEIALDVGVRGTYHALPYPVKRTSVDDNAGPNKKYKPEVHRMFYPMDIKLWRKREEIKEVLDHLVAERHRGGMAFDRHASTLDRFVQGSVKDFPRRPTSQPGRLVSGLMADASPDGQCERSRNDEDAANYSPPTLGRRIALLDELPYYAIISHASGRNEAITPRSSTFLPEVLQVVHLQGVSVRQDDESDVEDVFESSKVKSSLRAVQKVVAFSDHGFEAKASFEGGVEKLVLSDDDIIDD